MMMRRGLVFVFFVVFFLVPQKGEAFSARALSCRFEKRGARVGGEEDPLSLREAVERGGGVIDASVEVRFDAVTREKSVRSTRALSAKEEILRVPFSEAGTGAKGRLTAMGLEATRGLRNVTSEHYLGLWLLTQDNSYVDSLKLVETQHLPSYWSEKDLAMLRGSDLGAGIARRKAGDKKFETEMRKKSAIFRSLLKHDKNAWRWAMAMVRSRAFDIEEDAAMVPFIDLLNHRHDANCKWSRRNDAMVITSKRGIPENTELAICYGGDLAPAASLINYGFIEEEGELNDKDDEDDREERASLRLDSNGPINFVRNRERWSVDDDRYGDGLWQRTERRVQLGVGTVDAGRTALSLARVAVADDHILSAMYYGDADSKRVAADAAREPVSLENERDAFMALLLAIDAQLNALPTTLKDDLSNAIDPKLTQNYRNAAKVIASEKLVLYHWRALLYVALGVIRRGSTNFNAGLHYPAFLDSLLASPLRFVPTLRQAIAKQKTRRRPGEIIKKKSSHSS